MQKKKKNRAGAVFMTIKLGETTYNTFTYRHLSQILAYHEVMSFRDKVF